MRLHVRHVTAYDYDEPVTWGLQRARLTPKTHAGQRVLSWDLVVEGGRRELDFEDHHRNRVHLLSFEPGASRLVVTATGEVEVEDNAGVLGEARGFAPLWLFERATPRTRAGAGCRRIVQAAGANPNPLLRLHDLSAAVAAALPWRRGAGDVASGAEEALARGEGVCQDQAHVFLACARAMGVPSRYVSGYLLMDEAHQEAMHAWAEAWVPGLGWVGFDVANQLSPDARYVRIATGLDYAEAAPVSGTRRGAGAERLTVTVEVGEAT